MTPQTALIDVGHGMDNDFFNRFDKKVLAMTCEIVDCLHILQADFDGVLQLLYAPIDNGLTDALQ